jgi:hypothetical protein
MCSGTSTEAVRQHEDQRGGASFPRQVRGPSGDQSDRSASAIEKVRPASGAAFCEPPRAGAPATSAGAPRAAGSPTSPSAGSPGTEDSAVSPAGSARRNPGRSSGGWTWAAPLFLASVVRSLPASNMPFMGSVRRLPVSRRADRAPPARRQGGPGAAGAPAAGEEKDQCRSVAGQLRPPGYGTRSTEQGASRRSRSATLSSRTVSRPEAVRAPATIRSAPVSSTSWRISPAGSPTRSPARAPAAARCTGSRCRTATIRRSLPAPGRPRAPHPVALNAGGPVWP